jgi:transglutaminase-like putative cysteine protease
MHVQIASNSMPNALFIYPPITERLAVKLLTRPQEVIELARKIWQMTNPMNTWAYSVAVFYQTRILEKILDYIPDPYSVDFWKSPRRTWRDGGGDCEDLSIFVASLLAYRLPAENLWVVVGRVRNNYRWVGHAWVEGRDQNGWFLIEATTGEFYRHQRPNDYRVEAHYSIA